MKYLNKRQQFLEKYKNTNIREIDEDFYITESSQFITEGLDMSGSGPFGNDIPWGDSLVGRLINSILRKVGIAANMVRIQPVIARLKSEFDNILTFSATSELTEEQMKNITMIAICNIITIIHYAIVEQASYGFDEGDGNVGDLMKGLTEPPTTKNMNKIKPEVYLKECEAVLTDSIENIGQISGDFGEIDGQDQLIKDLTQVGEFIRELKKRVKEDDKQLDYVNKDKEKEEPVEEYVNNFTSVANIILEYDAMMKSKAAAYKSGATASGPSATSGRLSGTTTTATATTPTQAAKEAYVFEAATTSPIMMPLKKLYDTLKQISPQDLVKDMSIVVDRPKDSPFNIAPISNIYKYIRTKSGVKESILIKENLDEILAKDKAVGDVIIGLYTVSKTKPDGSFEGITPKMKQHLANFNKSMALCLQPSTEDEVSKNNKEQLDKLKKESFTLMKYNEFRGSTPVNESVIGEFLGKAWAKIKQLFSSDDKIPENENPAKVDKPEDLKLSSNNDYKILSAYWKEVFESKISKVVLTESEYQKLAKEMMKLQSQDPDQIVIKGMDPIIGVLKCFNRAYKIHTSSVIPGGRSGGKVSRSVFAEYDCFGGGAGSSGELSGTSGPYRNKKIFNMWENAVLDILGDTRYAKIFSKNTNFVVNMADKSTTSSGEVPKKEEFGPVFRKMITDLLDGETLYKSKGGFSTDKGGVQKEFLDKYFGMEVSNAIAQSEPEVLQTSAIDPPKIVEENQGNADKSKGVGLKFEAALDMASKEKGEKEFPIRRIFEIECTMPPVDDKEKGKNPEKEATKRYFLVFDADADNTYCIFSCKPGVLMKYAQNDFLKQSISATFEPSSMTANKSEVYLTRMRNQVFRRMLENGGKVTLEGLSLEKREKVAIGEQTTTGVKVLVQKKEGEDKPTGYVLTNYSLDDTKGFKPEEMKTGNIGESK